MITITYTKCQDQKKNHPNLIQNNKSFVRTEFEWKRNSRVMYNPVYPYKDWIILQ